MRSVWLLLVGSLAVAGCWVTRAELREKVFETRDTAESGDTGD